MKWFGYWCGGSLKKKFGGLNQLIYYKKMARSISKGPFSEILLKKKIPLSFKSAKTDISSSISLNNNLQQRSVYKVWSRRSMILPEYIEQKFLIYNGKTFISLKVDTDMVGHKFGEFANTRKKPIHKTKTNKKKR